MSAKSPWRQPHGTWEFWRSRWPRFFTRFVLHGTASAGLCAAIMLTARAGLDSWTLSAPPIGAALLAGALAPLTGASWENTLNPADSEAFRRRSVAALHWWGALLISGLPLMLGAVRLLGGLRLQR